MRAEDFESLLQDVLPRAYREAYYLTGSESEAEDLVQDAALHALKGFGSFQTGTNFRAWFLRILVNCFYMRRRKDKKRSADVSLDAPHLYLYSRIASTTHGRTDQKAAQALIDGLTLQQIAEAIAALPARFRVAATLYFLEDLSYAEIAEILECPVGTVRSRIHRGRKILQTRLWRVADDLGVVRDRPRGPTS